MLDSLGVCRHLWIYERSQSQIQLTESDRDPPTLYNLARIGVLLYKLYYNVDLMLMH